jgi:hypothetical protein
MKIPMVAGLVNVENIITAKMEQRNVALLKSQLNVTVGIVLNLYQKRQKKIKRGMENEN